MTQEERGEIAAALKGLPCVTSVEITHVEYYRVTTTTTAGMEFEDRQPIYEVELELHRKFPHLSLDFNVTD